MDITTLMTGFTWPLLAAAAVMWIATRLSRERTPDDSAALSELNMLFLDDRLVQFDTGSDWRLGLQMDQSWKTVSAGFQFRFPGLPESLGGLDSDVLVSSCLPEDDAEIRIRVQGVMQRITLIDRNARTAGVWHAHLRETRSQSGLATAAIRAPCPSWETDAHGSVIWENQSLQNLEQTIPDFRQQLLLLGRTRDDGRRILVEHNSEQRWYELCIESGSIGQIYYAKDVSDLVTAEVAQRNFVQTLTKTFANLSTGLAVFDRRRRLALFNPALVALTGLSPEFLSSHPDVQSFFDNLRDTRVLPEPKNYKAWRAQMSKILKEASAGGYSEIWSLPSNVTYKVTGRPHPDGAVAFLIEDISAEVSLNRRFRSQLSLYQAAMDRQEQGLFVFSASGELSVCNATASEMTGINSNRGIVGSSYTEIRSRLENRFGLSDDWETVFDAVASKTPLQSTTSLITSTGKIVRVVVSPLVERSTLLALTPVSSAPRDQAEFQTA